MIIVLSVIKYIIGAIVLLALAVGLTFIVALLDRRNSQ
jgi:hypothetical protein